MKTMNFEQGDSIGFNEDILRRCLLLTLFYKNANMYGEESSDLLSEISDILEKHLDHELFDDTYTMISDAARACSDYSYFEGFKEGVRLFRTMMMF